MMSDQLQLLDRVLFEEIDKNEATIERSLDTEVMYYYGEIRMEYATFFKKFLEKLAKHPQRKQRLSILLTTPGGSVEVIEKMVEVVRYHFSEVYFIVPDMAMSAGTIFCMSGDKVFMDYASSLGPIDPQVLDKEGRFLVPALGYLDKIEELIEKSAKNKISPAEFALLEKQDLAMLRLYEQARDLSKELLKKWLVQYKFKSWVKHRSDLTKKGKKVTMREKQGRAKKIASDLSDNKKWHSHGRMIGMTTLEQVLRLEIDDLSKDDKLYRAVRRYSDTLTDYLRRHNISFYVYNSRV